MAQSRLVVEQSTEASDRIVNLVRRVMRSVIRLFGRHVNMRAFLQIAKQVAVEEAHRLAQQTNPKAKITLSQLSLMTGLDTRTIKAIQANPEEIPEKEVCPEAALLARWATDPMFKDEKAERPMDLSIYGKLGTFQGLVTQYCGRGVSPDMVIKRLRVRGCVETVNHNWVRLHNPNWVWIEHEEEQMLAEASSSIHCISRTLEHNIFGSPNYDTDDKWFQRRVLSYRIPKARRQQAQDELHQLLQRQLDEVCALVRHFESDTLDSKQPPLGVGIYFWHDPEAELSKK